MSPARPTPRLLPAIERLRRRADVADLESRFGREAVVNALREASATVRATLVAAADGAGPADVAVPADPAEAAAAVVAEAARRLRSELAPSLRRVINATGVIVHTNLGRAPLARPAAERVAALSTGYSNLEYDLDAGGRGRRDVHAEALLTRITGAESAVVVNNNAAATLLMLAALARGREVIVSRGELVEIGGGFRVPEIMAQSGCVLREVGTTNRTRAADYAAAIADRTALILRVHPSNFRIEGFTERPDARELVALGRQFGVPVVEDLGSGNLVGRVLAESAPSSDGTTARRIEEPTVQESVATGFDVICFSGDKLLGGPQAGIVVGRETLVFTIRRHPLMRAVRVDKMTYAALETTLLEYATKRARETVPVAAMLSLPVDAIERRAGALRERLLGLSGVRVDVGAGLSTVGGGSAPGSALPTALLALEVGGVTPDALERGLRALPTPVIARIERDRVVLDLRTVLPSEDEELAVLLLGLLGAAADG